MTRRSTWVTIGGGIIVSLTLLWTARTPEAGWAWRVAFVAAHALGWAGLIYVQRHVDLSGPVVLMGALAFRVCLMPLLPSLSNDGYRYLWDGRVTVETERSPYDLRPNDSEFERWREDVGFSEMNSRGYYSVYPPASQATFALAVRAGSGLSWTSTWWIWKALMAGVELVAIGCLVRVVGPQLAVFYAWSPLAVVEVAGQGHTEPLVLLGVGLMLAVGTSRFPVRSIGVSIAGMAKLYPLALLPTAWRRDGLAGVAASFAVIAGLTTLVWSPSALDHVADSLSLFFGTFDEYSGPYLVLKSALYPVAGESAGRAASGLLAVVYAGAVAGAWASDDGTARSAGVTICVVVVGFVICTSTLHPWYWLPVLFVYPLLNYNCLLWLIGWSTVTYLGYVVDGASVVAGGVGWGGALWMWLRSRGDRGHGETASNRALAVIPPASSQSASE